MSAPLSLPAAAAGFEPVLAAAAGPGATLVSVSLDFAPAPPAPDAAELQFTATLQRATRTLAFVSGEARRTDGALAATASAVFRRE